MKHRECCLALFVAGLAVLSVPALGLAETKNSCVVCHADQAATYPNDVHSRHSFTCVSCHGGDPNAEDQDAAMSRSHGYLGKIDRAAVPRFCARCHSDASVIHRFKPQQRIDQLAQYQTSVHGKRLASGDTSVANCIDCHGVHEIREVRDPLSPVHPLRLPETCARCHADAKHMAKYKIETNQFAEYRTSVHWEALAKRGDLSAPSCATCHGNHGATPPQVASVADVCGSCHVLFADLYNKSPHKPVFDAMGAAGCTVCHSNHGIKMPSVAMLAGENAVCARCHDATSTGGAAALEMSQLLTGLAGDLKRSDQILTQARDSGMEVSEAQLRQMDANERLVRARVAVHAFRVDAVSTQVREGRAIAAETFQAGQNALQERQHRRLGLAVSLIAIFVTMLGLWLAIRRLEDKPREVLP